MSRNLEIYFWAVVTVLAAVVVGFVILNPIWFKLAVPGLFPESLLPPISAPIDGLYYIQNAELGYQWATRDPLSLWFHPLLTLVLKPLVFWVDGNWGFWIIGIFFAIVCLPLIYWFASLIDTDVPIRSYVLPLILIAPGGLELATGNAEIPVLFLNLGLLLSVLSWRKWWITIIFAALAILTKPNALYMIPVLTVYMVAGIEKRDSILWHQALIGITVITLTWLCWSEWVDWRTDYPGAYWEARLAQGQILGMGDIRTFFTDLLSAFLYKPDLRDQIRYSSALIVPIVNLVIFGVVRFSDDTHRYAMAIGNLAMLAVCLFLGNPNKIIVYSTTLPGHFASHLLFLKSILTKSSRSLLPERLLKIFLYGIYCLAMIVLYVFGTPQRWYH